MEEPAPGSGFSTKKEAGKVFRFLQMSVSKSVLCWAHLHSMSAPRAEEGRVQVGARGAELERRWQAIVSFAILLAVLEHRGVGLLKCSHEHAWELGQGSRKLQALNVLMSKCELCLSHPLEIRALFSSCIFPSW